MRDPVQLKSRESFLVSLPSDTEKNEMGGWLRNRSVFDQNNTAY